MQERVKMTRSDRAKQFTPFDALKGLQEALRLKEYEHERVVKGELEEEKIAEITQTLMNLQKNDKVLINYFEDGHYKFLSGMAKLIVEEGLIKVNNKKIELNNLFDIQIIK